MPKGTFQRSCEAMIGVGWEEAGEEILLEHAPELIPAFKNYCDEVIVIQKVNSRTNPFKTVLELTDYLNQLMTELSTNNLPNKLTTLLDIQISESEYSWLSLSLIRREHLLKSFSFMIEIENECNGHPKEWNKNIDDEIKEIITSIDWGILHFINYHTSTLSDPLTKIRLKGKYLGFEIALDELKTLISQNDIHDAEYFHEAMNLSVLCEKINEAEEWINKSQKLSNIPIDIHLDFMFFYIRFNDGYKSIAKYAARILPQLSKDDRRSLVPFLLKQIEVDYLDKSDLSADVIAEIILYQNELN